MLKFQGITKVFKTEVFGQPFTALKDVSFDVPTGSLVGFLGANGAGKTTSIKIIMDFIRADEGSVTFSPHLGTDRNEIFRRIGFLPERPYFYPNLTGHEFLDFMGRLSDMTPAQIRERTARWAPRFKMDHALHRELKTYSKGMLQRTGFLATILHDPDFIILDEPLSGLDPIGRKELKDVMVEVHRDGKTVFFSSHIVPDIEEICDRVVFLKDGKLAYDGSVANLLSQHEQLITIVKVRTPKLNLSTPVHCTLDFPDDLHAITVSESNKSALLQELVSSGVNIIGVEPIKPRLEEIFYQTRGQS